MSDFSRNYLASSFWLVLIVVIVLSGLYFIPQSFIDKHELRNIDIFSDIRKDSTEISDMEDIPEPPRMDTCKTGLVCFDDYTPEQNGLDRFFEALSNIDSLKRPVRIAFYGDSFIEGDILSGDFRRKMQEHFGGKGVGMMPLTSQTNYFRQTIIHDFGKWQSRSMLSGQFSKLGISGNVFLPDSSSWVYYQMPKKNARDSLQRVSIYYSLKNGTVNVYTRFNKSESSQMQLTPTDTVISRCDLYAKYGSVQLGFSYNPSLSVFGVSLEDTTGVIVDNFAMRGIPGQSLREIPQHQFTEYNKILKYDLVILEYGLNVLEAKRTEYKHYENEMIETVRYLKACFPDTDFLLISVSDRSMLKDGNYVTMPAIPAMVATQKRIASESKIVFWNLFEAMGGENSMPEFVRSTPPRANKDYTHLTFAGGEYLGNLLFETILYEKERYDTQKAYQSKIKK